MIMSVTTTLTTATYEIEIKRVGNHAVPPKHMPTMKVGETVRYSSRDGDVAIAFPDRSPFRSDARTNTIAPGDLILTLVTDDSQTSTKGFACRCFINLPSGETIGWNAQSPESGGEHHVRQP
jgi:hypothetical protein